MGGIYIRELAGEIALGLEGRQEVRFSRKKNLWGFDGFYVQIKLGFFKNALSTRYKPSFLNGDFHESFATACKVDRSPQSISVTFSGECKYPFPHSLKVIFSTYKDCCFIKREIELIPHADVSLETGDLSFSLNYGRYNMGYMQERLILGHSPRFSETVRIPARYREENVTAFAKETNVDLFDTTGLPGIVAKFCGMTPFCLVFLKSLPPFDVVRHFVARETMNELEVGAVSVKSRIPAERAVTETAYWDLFFDRNCTLENLIPVATANYWDMVERYPEEKLNETGKWMEISKNLIGSLFREKAFGTEPATKDGKMGWTVYTCEEHPERVRRGWMFLPLQYWGDYAYRFSCLPGREEFKEKLTPVIKESLDYLKDDDEGTRDFWRQAKVPCLSFFEVERMRCCLPLAANWNDTRLLDFFRRQMAPFVDAGAGFLDEWKAEYERRVEEHAGLDAAYYYHFPGMGWAYAAAGVFAMASELSHYEMDFRKSIRHTVVTMAEVLNGNLRFADMWHYLPQNISLLCLGWSVYANVRAYEFSGNRRFLDEAVKRMHWTLSMGVFREMPDDRASCRPVPGNRSTLRWRRNNPAVETRGWYYAGSHERWNAPLEMWQMVALLAPLFEYVPDCTGLRFMAFSRKNMVKVFPALCEESPDEPLWIPFEFPLSRKDKEQYGQGAFFQAAAVFEGLASVDNPKILVFSPSTMYGEKLPETVKLIIHNPCKQTQSGILQLADFGKPVLLEFPDGQKQTEGKRSITVEGGRHIVCSLKL